MTCLIASLIAAQGIFEPFQGLVSRAAAAFTSSLALLIVVISAAVPWIAVLILFGWLSLTLLRLWIRRRREIKAQRTKSC